MEINDLTRAVIGAAIEVHRFNVPVLKDGITRRVLSLPDPSAELSADSAPLR